MEGDTGSVEQNNFYHRAFVVQFSSKGIEYFDHLSFLKPEPFARCL